MTMSTAKIPDLYKEMLTAFDRICRENNLQYWLDFETLQAVIGNKTDALQLPIKVSMLRDDYRMMQINWQFDAQKELYPAVYQINASLTTRIYDRNFADNSYIEVIPYDYIDVDFENKKEIKKLNKNIKEYRKALNNIDKKESDDFINYLNSYRNDILENRQKTKNVLMVGLDYNCKEQDRIKSVDEIFPLKNLSINNVTFSVPRLVATDNHIVVDKPQITYVLLACCTCQRPYMLKKLLESVNDLILPTDIKVEMLIVDNDLNKTAKNTVEEMQAKLNINIHYVVEDERGLANARNRILEEAIKLNVSHIFMFDDDEELTAHSLIKHIDLYREYTDCLISSGVVINKFTKDTPEFIKKNIVFKQKTTKKTGQIKSNCASGNVFFPVSMINDNENLRFSKEYKFMGGEDGAFFEAASELGYTIIQNSDSLIYENVTEVRANLKYILKRAFYNGFSGSYQKFKQKGLRRKLPIGYILKLFLVLILNCTFLIPSILFGKTIFVNVLSMCYKTYGKIAGAIKNSPLEFYKEVYGE